jgi:putative glutamine amidotransferase
MQVLAVEEGGAVCDKDITVGNDVVHQQGDAVSPDKGVHGLSVKPGTKLHQLLGVDHVVVNSFHRQAVHSVPEGYVASAFAPDGRIEAIEAADERFILGVQFHPEMMSGQVWNRFFKGFVSWVENAATRH